MMSRELWLLRHGKSDWNVITNDFDRPLKKRGIQSAHRVGAWMKQQNLIPDRVISSPALRALETAKIVCSAIGMTEQAIQQDKRLYAESVERLKKVLAASPVNDKKVLLVGHNPELESLLIFLVASDNLPDTDKLMPTATLARLLMPDDWAVLNKGCAGLISITHAKSLTEGGI